VVVDLTALDHRRPLVEQAAEGADQAGLALAAFAEEYEVVPGEQGALQVGHHRVVEPDDAREPGLAGPETGKEVVAYLIFDRPVDMTTGTEFAKCRRSRVHCPLSLLVRGRPKERDRRAPGPLFRGWFIT
jgi:hypothetical protein